MEITVCWGGNSSHVFGIMGIIMAHLGPFSCIEYLYKAQRMYNYSGITLYIFQDREYSLSLRDGIALILYALNALSCIQ